MEQFLVRQYHHAKKIDEPARFGEFYFVNETDHSITFDFNPVGSKKTFMEKYTVAARSTTLVKQTQDSKKTVTALDFNTPFSIEYGFSDPLTVKFDNNKCLNQTVNSDHSALDIKNYAAEKLGERRYKFTITFTEADFNRSLSCP